MKLCEHNNILRCYASFVESNQLWLVTQYMDLGSSQRVIRFWKKLGHGTGII